MKTLTKNGVSATVLDSNFYDLTISMQAQFSCWSGTLYALFGKPSNTGAWVIELGVPSMSTCVCVCHLFPAPYYIDGTDNQHLRVTDWQVSAASDLAPRLLNQFMRDVLNVNPQEDHIVKGDDREAA